MKEKTAIIFSLGLISLQIIIKILKKFIKQPRPTDHYSTYGMPSTRAAVLFYIMTLFLLLICHQIYQTGYKQLTGSK